MIALMRRKKCENIHGEQNTQLIGKHKSSYGTSYVCTKCWRSIYTLLSNEEDNVDFQLLDDRYGIFRINGQEIYGYKKPPYKQRDAVKLDGTTATKCMKDFARPPIFDVKRNTDNHIESAHIDSDMMQRHPLLTADMMYRYGTDEEWRRFYGHAGNSGIFVCPFKDCGHISDADIQAALIIGLRAWYRDNVQKGKSTGYKKGAEQNSAFKKELAHYQTMGIAPIELIVPRPSFNDTLRNGTR